MPFDPILGAGYEPSSIGGTTVWDTGTPVSEDLQPGTTDVLQLNITQFVRLIAIQVAISPHLSAGVAGDINCTATLTVDGDMIASWNLPTTRDSWGGNIISELIPFNKIGTASLRLTFVTAAGGTGYNIYPRLQALTRPI